MLESIEKISLFSPLSQSKGYDNTLKNKLWEGFSFLRHSYIIAYKDKEL